MSLYYEDPDEPQPPYAPASTPGDKAPWCDYDDDIEVYVGRAPSVFCFEVSEMLIKHHSRYFKELIGGPAFNDFIRLPGEDPMLFGLMLSFIRKRIWLEAPRAPPAWLYLTFDQIVELWLMGERLDMPLIQNASSDLLVKKVKYLNELPDSSVLYHAWQRTTDGSLLRRLLVTLIRQCWSNDRERYYSRTWTNNLMNGIGGDEEVFPLMAVLVLLAQTDTIKLRVSAAMWRRVLGCEWHKHEVMEPCEGSEEACLSDYREDANVAYIDWIRTNGGMYVKIDDVERKKKEPWES
ncbi:hypothetical protein PRZ48_005900 [Zasmidium cellare]|uniref:BTB domain-containing protein n=1 Tax=Zasmidium cellare TaxID=395010 RepID=A0ABR0ELX2_ZASCE|nr:hypothetical protein PRZ48_005900 [Zasmidium cellare]